MFIPSSIGVPNSVLPQMEQNRLTQLTDLADPGKSKSNEKIKSLSHQFESIFVHQLLKVMRATIQKSGLLDSHATQMYESLYDEEMANLLTEQKSMGLAKIIYKDLARLEEKFQKARETSDNSIQNMSPVLDLQS